MTISLKKADKGVDIVENQDNHISETYSRLKNTEKNKNKHIIKGNHQTTKRKKRNKEEIESTEKQGLKRPYILVFACLVAQSCLNSL